MTSDIQQAAREGVIELAFGEPDLSLLPLDVVHECVRTALATAGTGMLAYGASAGAGTVRATMRDLLARREQREPDLDEIVVTGGISAAFDLILTLLLEPGDVVFVEEPTYSLGLRLLRDHRAHMEPVPFDRDGLVVEELAARIRTVRASRLRPRFLYTIPTFHNPTGTSLSLERRRQLVELAAAEDLLVIEDDAYRELWFERQSPPSLWSLDTAGTVIRLGSTSKTIAPGLRTGWLTAHPSITARYVDAGVLDSGGAMSHFSTFVAAQFIRDADYDGHVAMLRREYSRRRDVLARALVRSLPPGCGISRPGGGFFLRVTLPERLSASALLAPALARGVSFVPGSHGQLTGGDHALRLCYTSYGQEELIEGAARLGAAIEEALAAR